jgi:uncharacterized membrane protein SirB2
MTYTLLRLIHTAAACTSLCGFVARGAGVFTCATWVRGRLARRVPHVVDTILLLSAIGMLRLNELPPWATPWLRAKIIGLLLYIALGLVALRPARTAQVAPPRLRNALAFIGALLVFGYIVSVAVTKSPAGALSALLSPTRS